MTPEELMQIESYLLDRKKPDYEISRKIMKALDLINRQQAEIERLNRIADDLVKIADTRKKANFSLLKEKILLTRELKSAKAETTEQLSKKIESRLANNTDISNMQYQSIIFDISEACKETVGDAE